MSTKWENMFGIPHCDTLAIKSESKLVKSGTGNKLDAFHLHLVRHKPDPQPSEASNIAAPSIQSD